MPKLPKGKQQVGIYLPTDLYRDIQHICVDEDTSVSLLVEVLLRQFADEHRKRKRIKLEK